MRDASVRWGLKIGGAGSAIAVIVLFVSSRLLPISSTDTNQSFELVMVLILANVIIRFGTIGVMLSGAYYAGLCVERERLGALAETSAGDGPASSGQTAADRRGSLFAGVIVMVCYWLVSLLFLLFVPLGGRAASTQDSGFNNVETAIISGLLFVSFGAALGSMGGRSRNVRNGRSLLDAIAIPALPPVPTAPIVPGPTPTPAPAPVPTNPTAPALPPRPERE